MIAGVCKQYMVLLEKNRDALLSMIGSFKSFCKDKGLMLSTEKTKVLIFNKKKEMWKEK